METREEFDIPMLLWGEEYCVRVEPRVLSRPVASNMTKEKCVTIPKKDGKWTRWVYWSYLGLSSTHHSGRATAGYFPACSSAAMRTLRDHMLLTYGLAALGLL